MAAFKTHITVSTALGAAYTGALGYFGVDWMHAALAGGLCAVSGMLPDLDSDSGKPVQELFGVTAAVVPLLFLQRLREMGTGPEAIILFMAGMYVLIRFGVSWFFKQFTVHRGMFHSVPAALIAAEIAFLAHHCEEPFGQVVLALGVLIGFLSHLVLDELYSIDVGLLSVRANKAAGTALKLASNNVAATLFTWLLLGVLTYIIGIDQGHFELIHLSIR